MSGTTELSALLFMVASTSAGIQEGWGKFSAYGARSRIEVSVIVGTESTSDKSVDYWFRQTIKKPGRLRRTLETDTKKCPEMRALLRKLKDLPSPVIEPPFLNNADISVTADGVGYSLSMPAAYPSSSYSEMILHSNLGTPLAAWIDAALEQLAICQGLRAEAL